MRPSTTVDPITDQGIAQIGEMDSDLMSSSGKRLQPKKEKKRSLPRPVNAQKGFFALPFRNRLSLSSQSVNARHSFPIRTMAPDRPIDDSVLVFRFPHN